mgnify:FL=1
MSEFKDRNVEFPSRKKLNVKEIIRDEAGEIISLTVDETRCEGLVTEEGTKLNASNLNTITNSIANNCINSFLEIKDEEIKSFIKTLCDERILYDKNLDVIKEDLESVSIPSVITEDLVLPTVCPKGTTITWENINFSQVNLNGNVLNITRGLVPFTFVITARYSYGTAYFDKEYQITILETDGTDLDIARSDVNNLNIPAVMNTGTVELPTSGEFGSTIEWSCSSPLVSIRGNLLTINEVALDTTITLRAVARKNSAEATNDYLVTLKGVLGRPTSELSFVWTKNFGFPKSKQISIESYVGTIEMMVVSHSELIDISIDKVIGNMVTFTVSETYALNQGDNTDNLVLPYVISVTNNRTGDEYLVTGNVHYYVGV